MAIDDRTYPTQRHNFGNMRGRGESRHILGVSFGHTNHFKRAAAASAVALSGVTAEPTTATTITSFSAQPDVPPNITITLAGTTANILGGTIVVTGTNVEGKVITANVTVTAATGGTLATAAAFKTVTSVLLPATGASVTYSIGYGNLLGFYHRLPTGTTTANVRVMSTSNVSNMVLTSGSGPAQNLGADGIKTLQAVPSAIAVDPNLVELNTFTPATAPTGAFHMTAYYYYLTWLLDPSTDGVGLSTLTRYGVKR